MPISRDARFALIQLGVGAVGSAVIATVQTHAAAWKARPGITIEYYAVADSSSFLAATTQQKKLSPESLAAVLEAHASRHPLNGIPESMPADAWKTVLERAIAAVRSPARVIVVDCAVGHGTTELLLAARSAGAHLVLCNKDPLTGPFRQFQALQGDSGNGSLHLSATVGAGLPIASAVQAATVSGDVVESIAAVASGSLGQICTAMSSGATFPEALQSAIAAGYCEPDPRVDLSGHDVARKLLILARLAGVPAEMSQITVESLAPPGAETLTRDALRTRLPSWRGHLAERVGAAHAAGNVLRYVGSLDAQGRLTAGLRELAPAEPLAQGHGPDNVFVLHTARYAERPLIVAGPGAGVAVTAGAVVADILRAACSL